MTGLRCERCGGNLLTEPDAGGHIVDLRCLLCNRSPGEYTRAQLRRHVPSQDHVDRASQGSFPIWVTAQPGGSARP